MKLRFLLRAALRYPLTVAGLLVLTILVLGALFVPWLGAHPPSATFTPMLPPSRQHLLGTNDMGYDLWTEFWQGARSSLALGFCASLLSSVLGLFLGVTAGYYERVGFAVMRLVDVFLALPRFPLIILLAAFTRPGFDTMLMFFGMFGWPPVTRIIYARILAEKREEYIEAAVAVGLRDRYILFRHLLPSALPLTLVRWISEMQHVIMAEAGLTFLGLGDPTIRSWGMTLSHAFRYPALLLTNVWRWWVLPPGLAITFTCLALVFVGLALDTVANPRLRQS